MNFEPSYDFPIARDGHLIASTSADYRAFWEGVEVDVPGLPDACGCYVFIIRGRAWYVGMAEKQSFRKECFQLHKVHQYDHALKAAKGRPSLLLIPKMTPGGSFAMPSSNGHADIRALEGMLIGAAILRNPKLRNIKGTKLFREMNVPGFLNTRRGQARAGSVQRFKKIMGLD